MKNNILLVIIISLIIFGCKTPEPPLPPPNEGTVSLDKKEIILEVGKTAQLTPSKSTSGDAKNKEYVWISSNSTVATAEYDTGGTGKVTAISVGEVTITYIAKDQTISASCKVTVIPQNHGSVILEPNAIEMVFGQETTITPIYSVDGSAKDKSYILSLSDSTIATIKKENTIIKVTANRIGETLVNYIASDNSISASSKITIKPRSMIIGKLFYNKGAAIVDIEGVETGVKNEEESTEFLLVYNQTPTTTVKILKTIYLLDQNKKLKATYAIIEDSPTNRLQIEQYLEERYDKTKIIKGNISYYNAGNKEVASPNYNPDTMIGIFFESSTTDLPTSYPLGIKISDISYLQ